jgi:hypothetical protein
MSSIASLVAKKFSNSSEDQKSFAKLIAFLKDHPEYFGWRGKKMPNLNSENGVAIVAEKYFSKRHEKTVPSIPTTVPDPMVSLIMVHFYGHSEAKSERSAKSLMFRYLIDIGNHCEMFYKQLKARGRPPSGYTKLDLADPEQLALALLKTQHSK